MTFLSTHWRDGMIDDLLEGARNINVQYAQPQQQKSEILARISHVDQSNLPDVTWCWCGRKMPAVELDLWICFIFHHFSPTNLKLPHSHNFQSDQN